MFPVIITVSVSIFCVLLGAVSLRKNGVEWDEAWFQSLSAFTNSGFTTDESEHVLCERTRRRTIAVLMIAGHVGVGTLIVTASYSILHDEPVQEMAMVCPAGPLYLAQQEN
jgi:Trk-type K+ transport system membrane component